MTSKQVRNQNRKQFSLNKKQKQVLQDDLNKHVCKKQEYLLMCKGKPLGKQDINTILRDKSGKGMTLPWAYDDYDICMRHI